MAKKKIAKPQKNPDSVLLSNKCPYCDTEFHLSDAIGYVIDEGYILKCPECDSISKEIEDFEQDLTPFLEEVPEEPKKKTRTRKKKE